MPARKRPSSARPTTKTAKRTKAKPSALDPETQQRKEEYLALRAELKKKPRLSHKEQTAQLHAKVAEHVEGLRAKQAAAEAVAAEQARVRKEVAAREALEERYKKNPFARPIPPSGQTLGAARLAIEGQADPVRAAFLVKYMKAEPGQYGAGDQFLGVPVPTIRAIAKQFRAMRLDFVLRLLRSKYHEERLTALIILDDQFRGGTPELQRVIVDAYLEHRQFINNWDLVDVSAPNILGADAFHHRPSRDLLYMFAQSSNVWERRIAIVSSFYFIRQEKFADTMRLARILLQDPHDLIRKAVGWMLREVGKRDRAVLVEFLDEHHREMPRVMLRYAVEHFTRAQRARYI